MACMQMGVNLVRQEIKEAKRRGIPLFLCGLIHNYSIENPDGEGYLAIRGGKPLLSTSEVIYLVRPDVILIEGYSPDDTYRNGVRQGFNDNWRPQYNSPELYELIDDVDKLGIRVRGCDLSSYPEEHDLVHKLDFHQYWDIYGRLYKIIREKKDLVTSSKALAVIDEFLSTDHYSHHDEYDANHVMRACKITKEVVNTVKIFFRNDKHFQDYISFCNNAEKMMKRWFKIRDTRTDETIMEELGGDNRVLVQIGLSHITKPWGHLPSLLKATPHYTFINLQEHDEGDREINSQ